MRSSLFAIICVSLLPLTCASAPGWISRLPAEGGSVPAGEPRELDGLWLRPSQSRYGDGNREAHSVGRETQRIEDGRYEKLHLYRELVDGRETTQAYRETGRVQRRGVWVLLSPERSEDYLAYRDKPGFGAMGIQLPALSELRFEPAEDPGPLLFYFGSDTLTPLAYEYLVEI